MCKLVKCQTEPGFAETVFETRSALQSLSLNPLGKSFGEILNSKDWAPLLTRNVMLD